MKRLAILLVLFALVIPVALASKDKVPGIWNVDMARMLKESGQQLPEGADAEALLKQMSMTIHLNTDGTWVWISKTPMGNSEQKGNWKILKSAGKSVTIEATDSSGEAQTIDLEFKNENTITANHPQGTLHLHRAE